MPLHSMTGYGHHQQEENGLVQMWEIRSVNSRHLDPKWRLPSQARSHEAALDKALRRHASRGRVEISLSLQYGQDAAPVNFDSAQAGGVLDALAEFAAARGDVFVPDYNSLLSINHLWNSETTDNDGMAAFLVKGFEAALKDWNDARRQEGVQLAADLKERFGRMAGWVEEILLRAPSIKEDRFRQVRERLNEMLVSLGSELEEGRFLQEMVIMSDRLDVSEELTRLKAHLKRLAELLEQGDDAGRKLDFTLQECFREINTCGNKIQDATISRVVVDFKNELEKCREQVQNLE